MKKVRVKKFKDAYLKKPIEESLEKLEQFLEKPNYNKKQSTKLFKRMSKYRENEQLIFCQKKIDTLHGYYDYIVRKT